MSLPDLDLTFVHRQAVEGALRAFEGDAAVLAMWIEGSVGRGTADAWSDLDLHLAVEDAAFGGFTVDGPALLRRVGEPLGWLEVDLPGAKLLPATLAGPVRLDLYVEQRVAVARTPRHPGAHVLFDRDGVEASLVAAPDLAPDARAAVEGLMRGFFFGAMWPVRMTGRRDWIGLASNDTAVVAQFVVPLMLIVDGSPEFTREPSARARFLSPERQREVRAFLGRLFGAFQGIERDSVGSERLARAHAEMLGLVLRLLREACVATGAAYPERADAEYRAFYLRELGVGASG